jgi:lipoprotein-anchoring transpeptidase ErfK/SrfK
VSRLALAILAGWIASAGILLAGLVPHVEATGLAHATGDHARAPAATPPAAPAPSHPSQPRAIPDARPTLDQGVCVTHMAQRMLTPADLAHPFAFGFHVDGRGSVHRCVQAGLASPKPSVPISPHSGQVILVSLSKQWLWAYQDGRRVFATPITTGRAELETPIGAFHVLDKVSDVMFTSPWPKESPYYYPPARVTYALFFREGGYYIHDAPWRHAFGPGTNGPHVSPDGKREDGSHGCVNVVTSAGKWLYTWAHVGATIQIVA